LKISGPEWKQLFALLDTYLEQSAADRSALLARVACDSPDLSHKFDRLIAEHADLDSDDFAMRPLLLSASVIAAACERIGQAVALETGREVGPYCLVSEIGRGGMSTVWLATRIGGQLKRPVALKIPHVHVHSNQLAERFARERDILAGLTHPNIARLYDAGVSETGQPYLAMEYVEGRQILEHCDANRLGIATRLRLFLQVLAAVRYAHAQLVLHRDLKPSNILVTAEGQVLLLDFGIAKLVVEGAAHETELTLFGGRALTPAYASPEQISGEPLGTASDVYSLGVLLYEMLTGERPYRLKRDSRGALEEAILNTEPPSLSQTIRNDQAERCGTTPVKLVKCLRGDLNAIVQKALKKEPSARYATADKLAQDIEAYLIGAPVSARPDSRGYRARRFAGRHKGALAGVAAAIMTIVAGAGIALIEAHVAAAQRDRALTLASRNEAVYDFLNLLITDAAQSDGPITVSTLLARSDELISSENRANPEHQAMVLNLLANQYHNMGEDGKAESALQRALDLTRDSPDHEMRASLMCDHALAMAGIGKAAEAQQALHTVIESGETNDRDTTDCVQYLAVIAQNGFDAGDALKFSLLALEQLRHAPRIDPMEEAILIETVAASLSLNDRNEEADRYFADSWRRFKELGRESNPYAMAARNDWGVASASAGDPKRALELYDQTLELIADADQRARPPPYLLGNRGWALWEAGRYPEAQAANKLCVTLAEKVGQANDQAYCLIGLALEMRALDQLSAAEDYLGKAVRLMNGIASPKARTVLAKQIATGQIALSRRDLSAARIAFDAAIANGGKISPSIYGLLGRAEVSLDERKLAEAERVAREALALAQKQRGERAYSNHAALSSLMLARILASEGDPTAAHQAAEAAVANFSHTVDPSLIEAQAAAALALETRPTLGGFSR
jgi:tetratricopeptide (TPR) repeat protein